MHFGLIVNLTAAQAISSLQIVVNIQSNFQLQRYFEFTRNLVVIQTIFSYCSILFLSQYRQATSYPSQFHYLMIFR
jgi:hypothetical protein